MGEKLFYINNSSLSDIAASIPDGCSVKSGYKYTDFSNYFYDSQNSHLTYIYGNDFYTWANDLLPYPRYQNKYGTYLFCTKTSAPCLKSSQYAGEVFDVSPVGPHGCRIYRSNNTITVKTKAAGCSDYTTTADGVFILLIGGGGGGGGGDNEWWGQGKPGGAGGGSGGVVFVYLNMKLLQNQYPGAWVDLTCGGSGSGGSGGGSATNGGGGGNTSLNAYDASGNQICYILAGGGQGGYAGYWDQTESGKAGGGGTWLQQYYPQGIQVLSSYYGKNGGKGRRGSTGVQGDGYTAAYTITNPFKDWSCARSADTPTNEAGTGGASAHAYYGKGGNGGSSGNSGSNGQWGAAVVFRNYLS